MRSSLVLQARLAASSVGLLLVAAATPLGAQDPQEGSENLAMAESVIAREEAASEREFEPAFRAKARELLAALPLAEILAQTGDGGLGLNSLGDSQADLVYTPLTPCRIVDTRLAGGILAANTTRSFLVTGTNYSAQGGSATGCGVPYGPTTAAVINFVAVTPAGQGSLWVTPFGTPMPNASIINYTAGVNIANGLSVAICNPSAATCTQDITIRANNSAAHMVADVQGYFQKTPDLGVNIALANTVLGVGALASNTTGQDNTATGQGALGSNSTGSDNTATGARALRLNTTGGQNSAFGNQALYANTTGQGNSALGTEALYSNTTGTYNTAVGNWALQTNTTGRGNSALGVAALEFNTEGWYNSALGMSALYANTTGTDNSAFGYQALNSNTTAVRNSAFGYMALNSNTTAVRNSAFGYMALRSNTTAVRNSAFGSEALYANTTGAGNSAFGDRALRSNTTASYISAFGSEALYANTTGAGNSAFGYRALYFNTTGYQNSAFGYQALYTNTTGTYNSAFGQAALQANTGGSYLSAFGLGALQSNTTGYTNSAFGYQALYQVSSGDGNIGVGYAAGANLTSGSYNIIIGNYGVSSESNTIRIGGTNQSTTYIAGVSGQTSASGVAVLVNSSGKLGTTTSSRRYKQQIADMEAESDVLLKLRPVSFYYRPELDGTHLRQYGLVAEEVAEVAPNLVAYDEDGTPQTVRYHFVNAMLLNEVQEQRRLVEDQRRQLEAQHAEIRDLRAQESRILDLEARLAKLEAAREDQ